MAAPDRAPRRTAAQLDVNIATGEAKGGASASTYNRQSSGLSPSNVPQTKGGDTSHCPGGDAYKRNSAGVTPSSFPDTKVSK